MTEARPYQHASGPPSGYRQLYGAVAVVGFVLSFTQFYAREVVDGYPERLTLWTLLADPNWEGVAMAALLLLFSLVAIAVCGAVRSVRTVAVPVAMVVLSLVGAVMLMAKIGYSDPAPPFDDGGAMMLALAWGAVLLGVVHTVHLIVWRWRVRRRG